jgi:hypothetical protein
VLDGLGLGVLGLDRTLGSLSGGQRGRLAPAALLVRRPSALLLLAAPTMAGPRTPAGAGPTAAGRRGAGPRPAPARARR